MGKLPRVPIPARLHTPFRTFQAGSYKRPEAVAPLSDLWMRFTPFSNADFSAATLAEALHNKEGNYSYSFLIRGSISNNGRILSVRNSQDSSRLEIRDLGGAGVAEYKLRETLGSPVGTHTTFDPAFNASIHLFTFSTVDTGTNARLFSQVDNGVTLGSLPDAETRTLQGSNWPPDTCELGSLSLNDCEVGWFGIVGNDTAFPGIVGDALAGTGGDDLWAAYLANGRRGLSAALKSAGGKDPAIGAVLDGITPPDFGPSPILTSVTFVSVEV